jgi:hypothetical protein
MKEADPSLIEVIREDLEYVFSKWPKGEIKDDELRRSSTVLRRLLTYTDLHKVWLTVVGKKDFLIPSTWIEIVEPKRLAEVDFATASPAESSPGKKLFSAVVYRRIQDGNEPIRLKPETETPLYSYLFQKTVIIEGVPASRNDIVQFVANKLGGAHFDLIHQRPSDKALDAIRQFEVMNRKAAMYEMLSYGQQLERSASARDLLAAIRKKG